MISTDDFWDVWGVIQPPEEGLFEFEEIRDEPVNTVWTVVESGEPDDENWYAMPGFHDVNAMGYVLTKTPWEDATVDAIYYQYDAKMFC